MPTKMIVDQLHIPLALVPNLRCMPLSKSGKTLHRSAIFRWAKKGVGPNKVRLRTVQVGGRKCTTLPFLGEFFAALGQETYHPLHNQKPPSIVQKVDTELKHEGF